MNNAPLISPMLHSLEAHAHRVIVINQSQVMPTWILVNAEQDVEIEATPWADDFQKALAKIFIRMKMQKYKTVAYGFISEVWMSTAPKGWKPDKPLPLRPSENPKRKEAVMAFATDGEIKRWLAWDIKRNEQGMATTLFPNTFADKAGDVMDSWISELL